MIVISVTLFFINIILKYCIKLFLWNALLSKVALIIILNLVLLIIYYYPVYQRLRLSSLRKIKMHFPYNYIFKSKYDQAKSIIIFGIYILLFILGILGLRIYGRHRTVDLKHYYNYLVIIIKNSTYIDLIVNVIFIFLGVLLYYRLMQLALRFFKFHRVKLHLYCVKYDTYIYYHDIVSKYITLHFYSSLSDKLSYFIYNLSLKKLVKRSHSLDYDITRKENAFFLNIYLKLT